MKINQIKNWKYNIISNINNKNVHIAIEMKTVLGKNIDIGVILFRKNWNGSVYNGDGTENNVKNFSYYPWHKLRNLNGTCY